MLRDDARVLLSLWHAVASPAFSPRYQIAAQAHPPIVRVDVTVDGDDHEGAVENVGVGGCAAVGGGHDHGLLSEIKRVPVVVHLLHAHVRLARVRDLASRDEDCHLLRVFARWCSRRETFRQSAHSGKHNIAAWSYE